MHRRLGAVVCQFPQAAAAPACQNISHRIARQRLPAALLDEAEQLYRTASARFPSSAALHLLTSRFYSTYRANKRLSVSHILQAARMGSSSLHVQLLAYSARRDQESEAAGSGDGSVGGRGGQAAGGADDLDAMLAADEAAAAAVEVDAATGGSRDAAPAAA